MSKSPIMQADLREIKKRAVHELGEIDGVEGIGVGEGMLRIYVRDEAVRNCLPKEFEGVQIKVVLTGNIHALKTA